METFSKDTLFNDLPQSIKQKIVNIRNLSIQYRSIPQTVYASGVKGDSSELAFFEHVSVPSSKSLCDTFLRMAQAIEKLESVDATCDLKKELAEFSEFVNFYRLETNNIDFIGELEKTIGMMESKFEKIKEK
ncbi:uncharacterized protein VICG_00692 [Vittaforma corneae ATCC 50505]|uniref:Uncharacterized protein n=1 Tax=Vittaforma corneae (strain ATCC 50505) TaxID=993615 RepID=L2GPQ3_VITCO|nr:uncharacterized protein VICG_00692 [Vittaforma corneae ATCC 50505]ELA42292.1 hypothetical protein VICG_00692 [Vittaforma corneae ATCC 50505]